MSTFYIGLASTCHDPAIAIVDEGGEVLFAEGSERYLQDKRAWGRAPDHYQHTVELIRRYCEPDAQFVVASSWSQRVHWLYLLYYAAGLFRPSSHVRPDKKTTSMFMVEKYKVNWMVGHQFLSFLEVGTNLAYQLRNTFNSGRVTFRRYQHHLTHAALGCWSSPFDEAACLVVDGMGEFGALASFHYRDGVLTELERSKGGGSLGYFYVKLTELCGFDPIKGEEWKVMGLAPYGRVVPEVRDILRGLMTVEGTRMKFVSPSRLGRAFEQLAPWVRKPGSPPESVADLARTGQQVFAEKMGELLRNLHARVGSDRLVLTGGCALNSAYNGSIVEDTPFRQVHVPMAPGDDGNAVGAALLAWREDHPQRPLPPGPMSPYLGSELRDEVLENTLRFSGLAFRAPGEQLFSETARLLAAGKLVGWAQGRAEFGPRALGNRSILADPRSADMKAIINSRVKFREGFRPFAPSVLEEQAEDWFECCQPSPYMDRTLRWRPERAAEVGAVVHGDRTGRLQTVSKAWNPRFYALIDAFREQTGVPMLLNTSFNVMGKPIIHSVEDALSVFFTTGLDALVLGDYLLVKAEQGAGLAETRGEPCASPS